MPKADRRAAIAAELARRERESGVPPERHVYLLRQHYPEEGGPRTFFPVRMAESLPKGTDDDFDFDPNLVAKARDGKVEWSESSDLDDDSEDDFDDDDDEAPFDPAQAEAARIELENTKKLRQQLLDDAIEKGVPIEMAPDASECFAPGAPPADFSLVDMWRVELLVFSAPAAAALREMLEPACVRVPVSCPGHELAGYVVRAVEDVLDPAKTDASWDDYKLRRRATHIKGYSFLTERLGRSAIFTVPQDALGGLLVTQPFVDAYSGGGFNGAKFAKVWPHVHGGSR